MYFSVDFIVVEFVSPSNKERVRCHSLYLLGSYYTGTRCFSRLGPKIERRDGTDVVVGRGVPGPTVGGCGNKVRYPTSFPFSFVCGVKRH